MAQQAPLVPMPATPRTFKDWAAQWLETHYPNQPRLVRSQVRDEMWADIPHRFVPDDSELERAWWMRRFQDHIARSLGYVFTDGRDGDKWDLQLALPFADFQEYCIGKLVLARDDIEAVGALLKTYVEYHQLSVNVSDTLTEWKQAAGL